MDVLPNTLLQKLFIVSENYTEVEKILDHNGIALAQSITYLGQVYNSEILKSE